MDFPNPIPVAELAEMTGATLLGNADLKVIGINELHQVRPGDVTFVDVAKYFNMALQSDASVILLNEETTPPDGKALLLCPRPFEAFNDLVLRFRPYLPLRKAIADSARIHPSAVIEPNVIIGPHVVIGRDTHVHANTTIAEHTLIGERVLIQSGAVIGTEAFYFKREKTGYRKWRSGGRVVIEDDVEIGAACTINKGVSGDTRIGTGTKLDCQVHVGHDVRIGRRCLLAAQVGIGGNTSIGDECILYGQAGIAQNLTIGDRAVISAKAGVSKSLGPDATYFGIPAAEARQAYRELAALRHLPEFLRKFYK